MNKSEVHEQLNDRCVFLLLLLSLFISVLMVVLWSLKSCILDFGFVKQSA